MYQRGEAQHACQNSRLVAAIQPGFEKGHPFHSKLWQDQYHYPDGGSPGRRTRTKTSLIPDNFVATAITNISALFLKLIFDPYSLISNLFNPDCCK